MRVSKKTKRGSAAVSVHETKIYFASGFSKLIATINDSQNNADTIFVFDTQIITWISFFRLFARRNHVDDAIVNDVFYVFEDRDRENANVRNIVFALNLFHPSHSYRKFYHNRWTYRAFFSIARDDIATAIVKNKIYLFDGKDNFANGFRGIFDNKKIYDTRKNTWKELKSMSVSRHETGAVAVKNLIYIPGGGVELGWAPVAVNEGYFPKWSQGLHDQ